MQDHHTSAIKGHSVKEWFLATRPWAFPASAMPVLVTLGYLFWAGEQVDWAIGLFTMFNVVLFHAAGNTWSDYNDYKNGVDREDTVGGTSLTTGEFQPQEIKMLAIVLMAVAVACGLTILALTGLPTLWLGLAGAILTVLYPWMKYHALGDVDIFLTYAVLPMLGTSYVASGSIIPQTLWLAVPVGLITVGILHSNNTRDMEQDRRAEIKTFAMSIGGEAASYLYCIEVLAPFVCIVALCIAGRLPLMALIVTIALKPALDNAVNVLKYTREGMSVMVGIDEKTAQLQLVFSLLLFAALIADALLC